MASSSVQAPDPAGEREQLTVSAGSTALMVLAIVLGVGFVAGLVVAVYFAHPPAISLSYGTLAVRAWDVLAFSAAIGLASSAILQVAKQVFGLRAIWQQRWIKTWVESRCAVQKLWASWLKTSFVPPGQAMGTPVPVPEGLTAAAMADQQAASAWQQLQTALLGAYADRDLRLVFDLPAEQLCALLAGAADSALTTPWENAELLLALSGPAGLADIDLVAPPRGFEPVKDSSATLMSCRIDRSRTDLSPGTSNPAAPGDEAALGRLARSVRTGLDVLQASMTQRWSRAVRTWAVVLSGALGTVIVLFIRISALDRLLFAAAALLLGGFFAWLVRDLTAVVERVRR